MRVFISGGCKNGKSYFAQRLAKARQADHLYYIATMSPADPEDEERISRHRGEREGWGFTTVEQPVDIEKILDVCHHGGSFMLDSVTALLANEMFPPCGKINHNAAEKVTRGLTKVLERIESIVVVSDYIYSDAVIYHPLTEMYRKSLAGIDRAISSICGAVLEAAYTSVIAYKGGEVLDAVYKKMR
jgi:adenosylcobinamide kinase/adenosylcobinamide-phosphate guanylyltransferase